MAKKLTEVEQALMNADMRTGHVQVTSALPKLLDTGLVNSSGNLTRKGRSARMKAFTEAMKAFDE